MTAFHECGHAAAIIYFGGGIQEVRYGVWSGAVVPDRGFNDIQQIIISASGPGIECFFGFVFLFLAYIEKSPAVITFWTYAALFNFGFSLVLLPLFDFDKEGDFFKIYKHTDSQTFPIVVSVHLGLIAIALFIAKSKFTTRWYKKKTNPEWVEKESELKDAISKDASAANYYELALFYATANEYSLARQTIKKCLEIDKNYHQARLVLAEIELEKDFPTKALEHCNYVIDSTSNSNQNDQLVYAHALTLKAEAFADRFQSKDDESEAIDLLNKAIELAPGYGDPLLRKALTLSGYGRTEQSMEILNELIVHSNSLKWFNPSKAHDILPELNSLSSGKPHSKP
ncbi:MAG: M50 family metallopeptidase [Candidatus Melainabacteria bacterium]|nr:MAG: M50 family metallopeptidase [Candidatus Melainabacteria bacterium]